MNQLITLATQLDEKLLEKILEHDRWKLEATFAHEIKLEEIKISSRRNGASTIKPLESTSLGITEEDREFNELTSYGTCNDKHIGLIAKTKIWEGANNQSAKLFERWYTHIQKNNIIPIKDLNENRIKTLLLAFLWANGCGHRIAKWPEAKDLHLVETLKKDLKNRFSKFSKHSVIAAYESLKIFWEEINEYKHCQFNSSLIAEVLDEAYTYVLQKNEEESKVDIKKSPLFSEFEKNFPYVSLETLEQYYIKNRYNFVAAGVGALRKTFTTTCPSELEHKFSSNEWPKKWHIYLPGYESKWKTQLEMIQQSSKKDQQKWQEE